MGTEPTSAETLDSQQLLRVLTALKEGDFSQRLAPRDGGVAGEIAQTINATIETLNALTSEFVRITQEVGVEGKFGGQATIGGLSGSWKAATDSLNLMAVNLTCQVRNIAQVADQIVAGKSDQWVTVDAQGETLLLKERINRLVDQMSAG